MIEEHWLEAVVLEEAGVSVFDGLLPIEFILVFLRSPILVVLLRSLSLCLDSEGSQCFRLRLLLRDRLLGSTPSVDRVGVPDLLRFHSLDRPSHLGVFIIRGND